MCTVTWLENEDSYEVFCNRDELKTRKLAMPPRLAECNGVHYLAPIDADARGSWLGVNEHGVALCLVNHYPGAFFSMEQDYRSRGVLLTSLLDCVSADMFSQRLCEVELEQYRPFMLLAFELHASFRLAVWDGRTLQLQNLKTTDLPVTSSSFATTEVISSRKENFTKLSAQIDHDMLMRFHRSHMPERGAYSVCMHRNDAETVSFTHIQVTDVKAQLRYYATALCSATSYEELSIVVKPPAPAAKDKIRQAS